ncbi:hypothetical protein GQ600_2345 [Phytophthora cactorum]|nr:hypothetical protein GQ600_2345 [Phytophthora cactorum]
MSFTTTTFVNHSSGFDAALLEMARSRSTIYENTRMSGENARRTACCLWTGDSYARNMSKYFGVKAPPAYARTHSMPVSRQEKLLDEALLLVAHSQRSIYDKTRISGENRSAIRPLLRRHGASYARAMANYFVTKSAVDCDCQERREK